MCVQTLKPSFTYHTYNVTTMLLPTPSYLILLFFSTQLTSIYPIENFDNTTTIFQGTLFENQGEVIFSSHGYFSFLQYDSEKLKKCLDDITKTLIHFELNNDDYNNTHIKSIYNNKLEYLKNYVQNTKKIYESFLTRLGFSNDNDNDDESITKEISFIENDEYKHLLNNNNKNINSSQWEIKLECEENLMKEKNKKKDFSIISNIQLDLETLRSLFDVYFLKKKEGSTDERAANLKRENFSMIPTETVLSQTISSIQSNIQFMHEYALNVIKEINEMLYGKLSLMLLPPQQFEEVMKVLKSDENLRLIYKILPKYISVYYTISEIVSVQKRGKIMTFILRIPLKSTVDEKKYYLYKVTPLWFLNKENIGEKIELENKYMAIGQDHLKYIELSDMNKCTINNYIKLCTPSTGFLSIQNHPSCLTALFKKNASIAAMTCKSQISQIFPTTIIKTKTGWIISTLHPFKLAHICAVDIGISRSLIDISRGISYISPEEGCYLEGGDIYLPIFDEREKQTNKLYSSSINNNKDKDDDDIIKVLNFYNLSSSLPLSYIKSLSLIKDRIIQNEFENNIIAGSWGIVFLMVLITCIYIHYQKRKFNKNIKKGSWHRRSSSWLSSSSRSSSKHHRKEKNDTPSSPPSSCIIPLRLSSLPPPLPPPPPSPPPPLPIPISPLYNNNDSSSLSSPSTPTTTATTTLYYHPSPSSPLLPPPILLPPPPPPPPSLSHHPSSQYQNLMIKTNNNGGDDDNVDERKKKGVGEVDDMGYMICR